MNKAAIFLNTDASDLSHIKSYIDDATMLIGCDGGTQKLLDLGYQPHAIVGDFDSFDRSSIDEDIEVIEHPEDKDYTDSEAAIKYVLEKGVQEIFLAGIAGSRIDHLLGNIFLLAKNEFSDAKIKIIEGRQEIYIIQGQRTIFGKKGETISFLPILGDVRAKGSSGLKYDLGQYDLSMTGNSGISNMFTDDEVKVDLGKGRLLVIHEIAE